MPRYARRKSKSQVYHIMLRGNERKNIFSGEEDKKRFIDTLFIKKKNEAFLLYAYCIMDNHVHLIIKEEKEALEKIMKRIATSYAVYYNKKYKRIGHVFQDRYKSEEIERDEYLLAAIRYVHNNPVQANISTLETYPWSSIKYYLDGQKKKQLSEIDEILGMFSENEGQAVRNFLEFCKKEGEEVFIYMEELEDKLINEENAEEYINDFLKRNNLQLEDIKVATNRQIREKLIKEISENSTLSSRKIAELIGINRETVRKTILSQEPSL